MARGSRTKGSSVASKNATKLTGKRRAVPRANTRGPRGDYGLENLESRVLLSAVTPVLKSGVLTVTGYANEKNTISVALSANHQSIVATVDGSSATFATNSVSMIQVNAGSRSDSISIDSNLTVGEGLSEGNGIYDPTGKAASAGAGASGSTSGTPSTGGSSSGSTSKGGTSTGSSSGGSSTGTSTGGKGTSTGSTSGGTSSGGSPSGSTSKGSTGGTSSGGTTTSGGSTSSGKGSTGSTSGGSTTVSPAVSETADGTSALISFTSSQTFVAGLSVHVNALSSKLGAGTVLNATYSWNFGDNGSAYNTLVGFDAAHKYNSPGTYTITLQVTDSNGQLSTSSQKVTVQSTSSFRTIYVSPSGNDANSGASPQQAIRSISALNNLLGSNTLVYFQAGGTYTFSSGNGINVNHFQNVEITSYGSGAQPILFYNGAYEFGDFIAIQSGSNGILVNGLTFDSIYSNNGDVNPIPTGVSLQGTNINVTNCTFYNVGDDTDMSLSPTNVLLQGNSSPSTTGLNGYFAWVEGSDISIIGNTVANSNGEHIVRVSGNGADRTLIEDNTFSNFKKGTIVLQVGSYAYVYGNKIPVGPMGVGPLSLGTYLTENASFNYAVFDSNVTSDAILFQPNSFHSIAKNNVLFESGINGGFVVNSEAVVSSTDTWQVQDLTLTHNTVIDNSSAGSFLWIYHGESQGINLDNNLFIAPDFTSQVVNVFNNDLNSFTQIKDNVWALPTVGWWAQGGFFFVNTQNGTRSGYLTPQEWESTRLANGSYPTGDIFENVVAGSNYSVFADGFLAGSILPT
jgi:hypothetical protein